jgi:hypothetical protein
MVEFKEMQTLKSESAFKHRGTMKSIFGWTYTIRALLSIGSSLLTGLTVNTAYAIEAGPFTLNGFVKIDATRSSNQCFDCQRFPEENRQRLWADDLVPGKSYGADGTHVTLFQPWLGANFDLGQGYKLKGLLSQRWRDGRPDVVGISWFEKNIALSHEAWGSLRAGAMTSRSWSVADFPYGTDLGIAYPWAGSGAGYGLMTNAIRYTSRPFDVISGDLVLEATYDRGDTGFRVNKPQLLEMWAQYRRGDLSLDMMVQDSRNGTPSAWGQSPFTGLTPFASDDSKLGGSGQGMAMLMMRYDFNSRWQLSAGVRANRWSGAYAVITQAETSSSPAQWNNMFNVDWNGTLSGVRNPGYAATSEDLSLGVRHKDGQWTYSAGMVRLGKAKTSNPSERGQSNGMTLLTAGVGKNITEVWRVYAMVGFVNYDRLGLAPLSMPSNSAFTGVDSRIARQGNWIGLGTVYTF